MSLESLKSLLSKTLELKANTTVSVVTLCVSCSNPAVQVEAVENGALQTLLTTLATAQQLRVQKKVSTPTQLSVYVQKVGDNTLHRELDKRRQLDLFRFVKMLHLSSRKLSRLPWLVRMRTATDTHTHTAEECVYMCVCSFCLGSVCSGFPLASLPLCTASLPDTWGSAGPVRAVQDWQQWNSAYTHRHHVIRYDYWEGTVDARSCSSIPSPVQCSSSNTRSKWSEWLKLVSVGWDFPVPSSWDRSHDLFSPLPGADLPGRSGPSTGRVSWWAAASVL